MEAPDYASYVSFRIRISTFSHHPPFAPPSPFALFRAALRRPPPALPPRRLFSSFACFAPFRSGPFGRFGPSVRVLLRFVVVVGFARSWFSLGVGVPSLSWFPPPSPRSLPSLWFCLPCVFLRRFFSFLLSLSPSVVRVFCLSLSLSLRGLLLVSSLCLLLVSLLLRFPPPSLLPLFLPLFLLLLSFSFLLAAGWWEWGPNLYRVFPLG